MHCCRFDDLCSVFCGIIARPVVSVISRAVSSFKVTGCGSPINTRKRLAKLGSTWDPPPDNFLSFPLFFFSFSESSPSPFWCARRARYARSYGYAKFRIKIALSLQHAILSIVERTSPFHFPQLGQGRAPRLVECSYVKLCIAMTTTL